MRVLLTRGFVAHVDRDDYPAVSRHLWCASVRGKFVYAVRFFNEKGKRKIQYLHHFVWGRYERLDHKNGNRLDCRTGNLRPATQQQNIFNAGKRTGQTSNFKGVSWAKHAGAWRACITLNGSQIHLGYFNDALVAAKAYDGKAKELFGEFARTNL